MNGDRSQLRVLLQQTKHHDKDERYMAISDLKSEIETMHSLDANTQSLIRTDIFQRLEDSSSDVQAIAVNCFASIVEKFEVSQVLEIVSVLGRLSLSGSEDVRDVYTEGLKTVLGHVPINFGDQVAAKLIPPLLDGLADKNRDIDYRASCLVLVRVILERFRFNVANRAPEMMSVLLSLLEESSVDFRRLASSVVGSLSCVASDSLLASLMKTVLDATQQILNSCSSDSRLQTYIETIAHISHKSGSRVIPYLSTIVPLLEGICDADRPVDASDADEGLVELRENALKSLESLIDASGCAIAIYLERVVHVASRLLLIDPHWHDGGADSMEVDDSVVEDDVDDWGLEPDSQGESDVGDMTWKVRTSAVKVLRCVIKSQTLPLHKHFLDIMKLLSTRFSERELAVQIEIFATFAALLDTAPSCWTQPPSVRRRQRPSADNMVDASHACADVVFDFVPTLLPRLLPHLDSPVLQTRQGGHVVLLSLVRLLSSRLHGSFPLLLPFVISTVSSGDDVALQSTALFTLEQMLKSGEEETVQQGAVDIAAALGIAVLSSNTNTAEIALSVSALFAQAIASSKLESHAALVSALERLMEVLHSLIEGEEKALSVRAAASVALANFSQLFGDVLATQTFAFLQLLVHQLSQKSMRVTALKALAIVFRSSLSLEASLSPLVSSLLTLLSSFLDGGGSSSISMELRLHTLQALEALLPRRNTPLLFQQLDQLLINLLPLISEQEVSLLPTALLVSSLVLSRLSSQVPDATLERLRLELPPLISNPDLSRSALLSLSELFRVLMCDLNAKLSFLSLLESLLLLVNSDIAGGAAFANLAHCIATVVLAANEPQQLSTVKRLLGAVGHGSEREQQLSLLTVARIGSRRDLSGIVGLQNVLYDKHTGSEEVKNAAAMALGNVAVGNLDHFLPFLMQKLVDTSSSEAGRIVCPQELSGQQYFLLLALKDVFSSFGELGGRERLLLSHLDTLSELMLRFTKSSNEGVRGITSECLGKLLVLAPQQLLSLLTTRLESPEAHCRASVVTAFKFAFHHIEQLPVDQLQLSKVFALLTDADVNVRRQCFLALNMLLTTNAELLLHDNLLHDVLLPPLYTESKCRQELIRIVDFGQFKEKVDDGLLLRRACFHCLKSLCEHLLGSVYLPPLLHSLLNGVGDEDRDVQLLAYSCLGVLAASLPPTRLLPHLDTLPALLMNGVKANIRLAKLNVSDPVPREILQSFVSVLLQLHNLPGASERPQFHKFYLQVLKTAMLSDFIREVERKQLDVVNAN